MTYSDFCRLPQSVRMTALPARLKKVYDANYYKTKLGCTGAVAIFALLHAKDARKLGPHALTEAAGIPGGYSDRIKLILRISHLVSVDDTTCLD